MQEKNELVALMDYLVKHNVSHTEELAELANQVEENEESKALIMQAIEEYKKANDTLKNALEKLK